MVINGVLMEYNGDEVTFQVLMGFNGDLMVIQW